MRTNIFLLLALLCLTWVGCEKDSENVVTTTSSTITGELAPATISVYGQLTDNTGAVVPNALVTAGDRSTTSDQEGYWRINNAQVASTFGYVTFQSTGHLQGSRTIYARDGGEYEVDVELLSNSQVYTVDAASGGTIQLAGSDASITFGSSAFAKTDGSPVSGQVSVVAHYLDASEDETYRQMPGDLRALAADATSQTDFTLLTSFGMMGVELRDASGAEVELASGQTATLSMPLSAEALANAPATIPLWYFDDIQGIWIEEGEASLQGNAYVGEVSHFTFWNCDIPTEYTVLCGQVLFPGTDTSFGSSVYLSVTSQQWGTTHGYTDRDGYFCGIVPAGEVLTFSVYSYALCQGAAYTQQIGPLSDSTNLGTITVSSQAFTATTVTGRAVCNGAPVTSGAVRIFQNGSQVGGSSLDADGTFDVSLVLCDSSEITIKTFDYSTFSHSNDLTASIAAVVDLGDVESCQQGGADFFELIIDGVAHYGSFSDFDPSPPEIYAFAVADSSFAEFTISLFDSTKTAPFTPGLYTHTGFGNQPSPGLDLSFRINGSRAYASIYDFDLRITQVATQPGEFTIGSIRPMSGVYETINAVQVPFNFELNFSAPYAQ